MKTTLNWKKGTPPTPGIYFVALKLGQSIGRYDFMLWSGEVWETDQQVEIIAYVDADDIKTALSPEWPENSDRELPQTNKKDLPNDIWVED
ncbi:hypothetical protein HJ171_19015 [Vibrio parahaemolyticus]|uniref:hypothetical protein n=3 Tax=Vibrio parahaemolyticus TaxID=670 RepID=UPI00042341FB|nr:hypothetical protein [Vibrio parahaemolyticus]EGR2183702.1 hypothetical protein [Vibrio parahaemolyticus]EGR3373830.1 hypothetical protein [Vibrio parahaemolyticus]EHR0554603.1 hypothetical protein [Vibrio parahaemolyticus]EHR7860550.1 hypothetical protein [Vibrio parahaemolyticus]EJC6931558.1 hypothetical protein [Vibrio parahaemolyticus]